MVGSNAVSEHCEDARTDDVVNSGWRFARHVVEVRWVLYIRGIGFPCKKLSLRHTQHVPMLIAVVHLTICLPEHIGVHRLQKDLLHLALRRPDIAKKDELPIG